ncbi:MAG: Omp28-related outer membrane protein [Sphingomonadales bacterium]|nr:Omp28-related outer membrane protein [Sphingomonadales bacterium]
MKKSFLLIAGLFSAQLVSAQLFTDNFDNYALGSYIGPQSSNWTTWSGTQGGAEDVATTNNQAASAPHSVYFSSTSANGGPQDVVLTFGQLYNSGVFTLSADFYVNNNKGAYYNIQGATTIGNIWALNVHMDAGELAIDDGNTPNLCVAAYPQATWFNLKIEANLTLHVWKAYLNNVLVGTWVNGVNTVASADYFPLQNNQFFVDNVSFDHATYTLPALNAMVASLDMGGNIAGQIVSPSVSIINAGQNALTSFDVNLNYNGQNYTQNITGVNVASIASYTVNIPTLTLVAGINNAVVTISNINGGNDDNAADNTLSQEVDPVVPAAGKIVVGEEATGTWCQWCPRGAVFMDLFASEYDGFWAGIAVHNGDPMVVADYDAGIGGLIGGYPSALVDRLGDVDPSQMSSDFFERLQTAPKGVPTNGATWDPATRVLNVSVSTEMMQATNGSYKVACVLTEDGVTGSGNGYNQSNAYAGGNNGTMGGFESLPNPVPAAQMVYDHVARAIAPSFAGQTGIIAASTTVGDNYIANFSFTLPSTWDETQMHIVGMLIDPQGKIDNAGYTTINQAVQNGYVGLQELISGVNLEQMLTVAPNPATDFTNITLHIPTDAQVSVRILDAKGGILQARQYGSLMGDYELGINTTNFTPGLYVVEMQMNGQRIQKKLIIK